MEQKIKDAIDSIMKIMSDNDLEFFVNQTYNIQVKPKVVQTGEQTAPKEEKKVIDIEEPTEIDSE